MSPAAIALAVLLHALLAVGLWELAKHQAARTPFEDAIEVTVEPPPPPKPPEVQPPKPETQTQPPPPIAAGLRPPADIISDKPTQAPQAPLKPNETPVPQPTADPEVARESQKEPPVPTPAPPEPTKPEPPKPAQQQASVAPPAKPTPPPPPALVPPRPPVPQQRPELQPSPLSPQQRRPPAASSAEPPSPHPFVNPADAYSRARVSDNYLWQVVRKLQGYRYMANTNVRQGTTVVRVVIARDGRLLDVTIAQSSGVPEFDRGVLAGVRDGSPYAPLPDEIKGASATFTLPLVSINRQ